MPAVTRSVHAAERSLNLGGALVGAGFRAGELTLRTRTSRTLSAKRRVDLPGVGVIREGESAHKTAVRTFEAQELSLTLAGVGALSTDDQPVFLHSHSQVVRVTSGRSILKGTLRRPPQCPPVETNPPRRWAFGRGNHRQLRQQAILRAGCRRVHRFFARRWVSSRRRAKPVGCRHRGRCLRPGGRAWAGRPPGSDIGDDRGPGAFE